MILADADTNLDPQTRFLVSQIWSRYEYCLIRTFYIENRRTKHTTTPEPSILDRRKNIIVS